MGLTFDLIIVTVKCWHNCLIWWWLSYKTPFFVCVFSGHWQTKWQAVRCQPSLHVIFSQYCPVHAQASQPWLALIAHPEHCQFILRFRPFMQHLWFASKHVFSLTGLLHATHVALYDLRLTEKHISSPQWWWVDMTGIWLLIWPDEGNRCLCPAFHLMALYNLLELWLTCS